MSLVRLLVTMSTSCAMRLSSLIAMYTMRLSQTSGDWKSRVTAKKRSVASLVSSTTPWCSMYTTRVRIRIHFRALIGASWKTRAS